MGTNSAAGRLTIPSGSAKKQALGRRKEAGKRRQVQRVLIAQLNRQKFAVRRQPAQTRQSGQRPRRAREASANAQQDQALPTARDSLPDGLAPTSSSAAAASIERCHR